MDRISSCFSAIGLCLVVGAAAAPASLIAQGTSLPARTDSVTVTAGMDYAAGSLRRSLLGDNYRDIWTTPIRVPVLNLETFGGGLAPTKLGGGHQAASLHLVAHDSAEYVFRVVEKTKTILPPIFDHTIIQSVLKDQESASHPTGAAAAGPMLDAVGILHPHPMLVVMPDDPRLGKYRKEFAGVLGWIEEFPAKPKHGPAFANATNVIDSDALLEKLNKDPKNQVDAHAFLTAMLMDLVLGDNDRHPAQWKWAQVGEGEDAPWEPIPRDRDKVFVSYQGKLLDLIRPLAPDLVAFERRYSSPSAMFDNAMDFDRRMVATLDKSAWDSTATYVTQSLTDAVIAAAIGAMPSAYAPTSRVIADKLKARRDHLRAEADTYYRSLWEVADIHATDASDHATIVRAGDGLVDVSIRSGKNAPWFQRRFDAHDTREIRLYLHGGDDSAMVTGDVKRSILVRVIGGNGRNSFVDSSTVAGNRHPTRLYDSGTVRNVTYADDSVAIRENEDLALDRSFDRRPWLPAYGTLVPPGEDHGASVTGTAHFENDRGLGVVGGVGLTRHLYGFRDVPYETMMRADVAYASSNRYAFDVKLDRRFPSSMMHMTADAGATQMAVVQFHGLGNALSDPGGPYYDVRQTQYHVAPALGVAINPLSDLAFGPVVRYTTTENATNRYVSQARPYGVGTLGEAGVQLRLHYDNRSPTDSVKPRVVFDVAGNGYPALWDVSSAYGSVEGVASTYLTLPVATRPVLALRAGGKKLYGDFPYFDAAYVGGSGSVRTEDRQRFAGDASVYGSSELRIPIAHFPLVLPLNVGVIGFADAGRVYVNGQSPGGWHSAVGGGFWIGVLKPGTNVNVLFTNDPMRRVVSGIGFAF